MSYIGRTPTNAALTAADLADGIVSTDKIAADAVTDAKIADDVVGTEHLTANEVDTTALGADCLLYTSPSPRDGLLSRMPSSA